MNQFVKGRTDNHLTWVMVDSTDFATPESALSAAMKIKIYGKLRSATGVNFVSSGTGSLTNDIQHVGASVLGIYTIALAKADLSDASAAWYDQYVISLSSTGAAYQALVVDGGIDASTILAQATQGNSRILLTQSLASDAYSAALLTQSLASDAASAAAQTNSRVLLVQSRLSDFDSRLVSDVSDIRSFLSDLKSLMSTTGIQLNASSLSDLRSAITAGPTPTITASDMSDIASRVWADAIGARVDSRVRLLQSTASDAASAAAQANSRVLINQSAISDLASYLVVMSGIQSDLYSQLSDFRSDLHSFVSTTGVQLNASSISDLRSAITAVTATLSASDLSDLRSAITASTSDLRSLISTAGPTVSDLASAIWNEKYHANSAASTFGSLFSVLATNAAAANSRVLLNKSAISDIQSYLAVMSAIQSDLYSQVSDFRSDLHSFVSTTGVGLHASAFSDIRSAIAAGPTTAVTASDISDIASAVWANTIGARVDSRVLLAQSAASDAASAAQQANSRALVVQSLVSDVDSALTSRFSDLHSFVSTTGVGLHASALSDIRSAVTAAGTTLDASALSDIASAVWANAIGTRVDSRVLINLSAISDVKSAITLLASSVSDVQSAVALIPATKLTQHAAAVLALVVGVGSTTTAVKFSTVEGGVPSAVDDFYNGRVIVFTSGALAGQATSISDYTGATTTATVVATTGAPANTVTAVIV